MREGVIVGRGWTVRGWGFVGDGLSAAEEQRLLARGARLTELLKQAEGVASNQVMLKVRFAEVSRNALQELGASLFSDGNNNQFGRTSTQQFAAPFFDKSNPMLGESLVFSDYLNLFLFDAKNHIGAVVKALRLGLIR